MVSEQPGPRGLVKITVEPCNCGDARVRDIEAVLVDTASHIERRLREPLSGTIVVLTTAPEEDRITLYRHESDDPFPIKLSSRNRKWSQFAFQFAHEFCHVLSGYESLRENPNNWFGETLCEVASLFCLRRKAESWQHTPSFPNWAGCADSLLEYVDDRWLRDEAKLPPGTTLGQWLFDQEDSLRRDAYPRGKNSVVAHPLLPIFEAHPSGWNAVRRLPNATGMLADYLAEWQASVDTVDRDFVARVPTALWPD